ncbi:N-acetylmuramoyl-L-alanine amidase [Marinilactibacillus psychrotolerans]|uniref:N-acetylmuramoyl-L-alanine amidase n=1 Tax=Marinilactibacillus psychrotolerans TaxID=191770 RepID=UPI0038880D60
MTILFIDGHGERPNGSFDSGATGLIKRGEHLYVEQNLFPAMRKYLPKGSDVVLFSDYNVYAHGNIVNLANSYGKDTIVVEVHYDAGDPDASGGHVIVYSHYDPDEIDLRLRDAIADNVGVRYSHEGHHGISGRSNLANVNRSASGRINYRLIELGFGTNKKDADVLINKTDQYAKALVEAVLNKKVDGKPLPKPKPVSKPSVLKPVAQIAQEVIAGLWGSGKDRVNKLNKAGYNADVIQSQVNHILLGASAEPSSTKSTDQIAQQVIDGEWGNGVEREKRLKKAGFDPDKVQAKVNAILKGGSPKAKTKPSKKSIKTIAQEVIDGKWGNGSDREKRLNKAGYNADKVQAKVNQLLSGGNPTKSIDQMAREVIAGKHGNGNDQRQKSLGVDNGTYAKVRARVNQIL